MFSLTGVVVLSANILMLTARTWFGPSFLLLVKEGGGTALPSQPSIN